MKPPVKKHRKPIEKAHYWLQIDFLVRADTLESAVTRCGLLFRKAYRNRLTLSDTLIYMGAHGAVCRGGLAPKRPGTYHNTVALTKGLPSIPPARTPEGDEADRVEKLRKTNLKIQMAAAMQNKGENVTLIVEADTGKIAAVTKKKKKSRLGGLFK